MTLTLPGLPSTPGLPGSAGEQLPLNVHAALLGSTLATDRKLHLAFPGATDLVYPDLAAILTGQLLNNVGDPWQPGHGRNHTKSYEIDVVRQLGVLFGADPQQVWGYVTSGATEGTLHALHDAVTTYPDVVVYTSTAAHYSVTKCSALVRAPLMVIRADPHGRMLLDELRERLTTFRDRPAMIVATVGSTEHEGVDDVAGIATVCHDLGITRLRLHVDAALAGIPRALLPAHERPAFGFDAGATSLVVSGHKFLSTLTPCANPQELRLMGEALRLVVVRNGSECCFNAARCWLLGSVFRSSSPLGAGTPHRAGLIIWGVVVGGSGRAGAARLELVAGVVQLHPRDAMFEAMLRGWRAQQTARGLREDTIAPRERLVRRFLAFTNEYPWDWTPAHVDEWTQSLVSEKHLAPSTIRGYQTDLRLFSEYLADGRYGWAVECDKAFGAAPVPICHEWNTIAHLSDYEGSPEARPFTRQELQRFLDYADGQVDRAVNARRKGALAAYRDATLFKVIYGWGLRRTEASRLDVVDWGRNPNAAAFGRFGLLQVRYGKAVRGQLPRRRTVLSVMAWAVEAVADYVDNVRPRFGCGDHPALWVTERGGRIRPAEINARFVAYRDALGLPAVLTPHSLRHSYVTHLTEDGVDRRFVQEQVGHRCDTSTAIYTHVSGEFMNAALARALAPALAGAGEGRLS